MTSRIEPNELNSEDDVFHAMREAKSLLDKLPNKRRHEALKGLLGFYGLKPVFSGPEANRQGPIPVKRDQRKGMSNVPTRSAPPMVKKIREQIDQINDRIKSASAEIGRPLPTDHPLIQERSQFFRDLKKIQARIPAAIASQNEAMADENSPTSA